MGGISTKSLVLERSKIMKTVILSSDSLSCFTENLFLPKICLQQNVHTSTVLQMRYDMAGLNISVKSVHKYYLSI
jgi:hypothetical protein